MAIAGTASRGGKTRIDFTSGPLFRKMLTYALPIIATSILSNLYNVADKVVVGQFSGDPNAIGAIGSTNFFVALVTNFLIGLSTGVGVIFAQLHGAGNRDRMKRAVPTALMLGIGLAAVMTAIGYLTADPVLRLLNTKEELFDGAMLYLQITFTGLFAVAIYNIGAAILRAVGDSKTPLVIGAVSGAMNVVLNIFFVCVCGMAVDGVAIATVVSQYFSAAAVVILILKRKDEAYYMDMKAIVFDTPLFKEMLRLGIPTGLQNALYSITSMITSWAVNSFPTPYITARSIALDIDHIVAAFVSAFSTVTMNATGQNIGAKRPDRVRRVFLIGMLQALTMSLVVSGLMYIFRAEVASIFVAADDPNFDEIIAATVEWSGVMLGFYFTNGILQAVSGSVRGMGYSISSLIANLVGTCGTRILWVYLVFPLEPFHTFGGLALLYPTSWGVTGILLAIICVVAFVKLRREEAAAKEAEANATIGTEAENATSTEAEEDIPTATA